MIRFTAGILAVVASAGLTYAERAAPATFHIDSEKGDDAAAGTAENAAWKTLDKVNAAELIPGDRVLFKIGRAHV